MILENLKPACGSTKAPKRKGRGQGSGNGNSAIAVTFSTLIVYGLTTLDTNPTLGSLLASGCCPPSKPLFTLYPDLAF